MFERDLKDFFDLIIGCETVPGGERNDLRLLKKDIASGNYAVSPGKIADKMLSAQLFLFSRCP